MKVNELRIGNYIQKEGRIGIVRDINSIQVGVFIESEQVYEGWMYFSDKSSQKGRKGIPLTEQWLKEFRFEYNEEIDMYYISRNGDMILSTDGYKQNPMPFQIGGEVDGEIESVHRLQNLYFALTGKELIK